MASLEQQLLHAASVNNRAAMLDLFKQRVNVNATNEEGQSALHLCASYGHSDMALQLLFQGAQVDMQDGHGWTPLLCAASSCNSSSRHRDLITNMLKLFSADVTARTGSNKTVLHFLARCSEFHSDLQNIVELVIKMGGDVNAVDRARETPLHQAALFGCDGMVKLLIAFGAFVDARDEFGQTPLHLAARSGSSESVTVLLKFGAEPAVVGPNGTPRDEAFMNNNQGALDALDDWESMMSSQGDEVSEIHVAPHEELHRRALRGLDGPELFSISCDDLGSRRKRHGAQEGQSDTDEEDVEFEADGTSSESLQVAEGTDDGDQITPRRRNCESAPAMYSGSRRAHPLLNRCQDYNLELGTMCHIDTDLTLEYKREHDEYPYTEHFARDPEMVLNMTGRFKLKMDQFHPHFHFVGFKGKHECIISLRSSVSVEFGAQGYYGIMRCETGDTTFVLQSSSVKKARPKYLIQALTDRFESLHELFHADSLELSNELLHYDQIMRVRKHKIGLLYYKDPDTNPFEVEESDFSPHFAKFAASLGETVKVAEHNAYCGDLKPHTASHGIYTRWNELEFMFQLAAYISKGRRDPVTRNTITTVVFLEDGTLDVDALTSHVLHNIIVVQPLDSEASRVRVACATRKGIPRFRPTLPMPSIFVNDDSFVNYLMYKIVNGERAAFHCASTLRNQSKSLLELTQMTRRGQLLNTLPSKSSTRLKVIRSALPPGTPRGPRDSSRRATVASSRPSADSLSVIVDTSAATSLAVPSPLGGGS